MMRSFSSIVMFIILIFIGGCKVEERHYEPKSGDIIFHKSHSEQSEAITLATGSNLSHVGIVYIDSSGYYVLEAIGKVTLTPLTDWINKGDGMMYAVKRLKGGTDILEGSSEKLLQAGKSYIGIPYDIYFGWSDDKMYCSELVYKVFDKGAGIKIAELQKMKDFDLTNPVVKELLQKRYGSEVPLEETVISPKAIFDSPMLETVYSDF